MRNRLLLLALGFGGFGAMSGAWASRLPSLKARLDLENGEVGLAIFCAAAGTLAGAGVARRVIAALTPSGVGWLGVAAFGPPLLAIALAPGLPSLCAVMLVLGLAIALYDIALNAEAVRAEAAYGRAVLSRLHAGFSLGLALGAGSGAAAEAARLPLIAHFAFAGLLLGLIFAAAQRGFSAGAAAAPNGAERKAGWSAPVVALTLFGLTAMLAEGVTADWSALLVAEARGGGRTLGALALAAFAVAMTAARLAGDWVVDRLGRPQTVWLGAGAAVVGLALSAAAPGPVSTIGGLAMAGLGLAPLFPNLTGLAAAQDPERAEAGVARIAAASYAAFLVGPAASGWIADRAGLPVVFALVAGLLAGAAVLAWPILRRGGAVSGSGA